jgi:hypothetical protein
MANLTDLNDIISEMKTRWVANPCKEGGSNGFHFGWPQEVDDIHQKTLPLMIVNPPSSTIQAGDIDREYGIQSTRYVVQVYEFIPSDAYAQTPEYIANFWDSIENCFYTWLENVLNGLGPSKVIMRDGTINITRTKEASNDRLFMCQFEFNLSTYRTCLTLV